MVWHGSPVRFLASAIAAATGGRLVGPDVEIGGVVVDSRGVRGGELFVPVEAERDGHDFVSAALAAGAAAYLTNRPPVGGTAVAVADTGLALQALGSAARQRLPDRVVGITGSVGKTSVKDLLASALARRWRTASSPHSFNNELGVPLTLCNAADETQAVAVEMGSRGPGHIRLLCGLARPTVGVITAVAAAHTETFGSLEAVARSKAELVEALPPDGTAVLNGVDARVRAMASLTAGRVLLYGGSRDEVVAEGVVLDGELLPSFLLRSPWGSVRVQLAVRGAHQVGNALAAGAAALAVEVALDDVAAGLEEAVPSPWRMELGRSSSGLLVLNDAYNANPASVSAALRALAGLGGPRKIAFLGTMAELGSRSAEEHRDIAAEAATMGIRLVAVAEPFYGGELVHSITEALALVAAEGLGEGDAVLVKGSRVAGLERLAAALLGAS